MAQKPSEPPKRGRGRPPKAQAQRKRAILALRIRDEMKATLTDRAAANQRSISEEAESLLERALQSPAILDQALDLAFGPRPAALLLVLGRLIGDVSLASDLSSRRMPGATGGWLAEPFNFEQVKLAIDEALEAVRPPGDVVMPDDAMYRTVGLGMAVGVLSAVIGNGATSDLKAWAEKPRSRLDEEILDRIAVRLGEVRSDG